MNIYLTVMGSGAASPTGKRHCSAQVLNIRGFKLLIDCAEGTQDRIRQHHLKLQSLSTIVISHLHGDHFFGLPGLLSTMHLCGRTEPVTIVAPKGAKEVIETIFELTGNHIEYSIEWLEMDFEEGEQRVFENGKCTVDAFRIDHTVPTYGFRVECKVGVQGSAVECKVVQGSAEECKVVQGNAEGHSLTYAYCCDTAYDEAILPHIEGADLLCLECTFANELGDLAEQRKHLTAGQAGLLAQKAGVKQLLLTHLSARYKEPDVLLQQAREEFANSIMATDGMRMEITANGTIMNEL